MESCSLLSEKPFIRDNIETVTEIFERLQTDFPASGAVTELSLDNEQPTGAAMAWMWRKLMGRQHGNMEPGDGKLSLDTAQESAYLELASKLHYGPYNFLKPTPLNSATTYDKALVLGGTPDGMTNLLLTTRQAAAVDGRINDVVLMAGQRLRWDLPSEADTPSIFKAIHDESGTDMERLRGLSPWLQAEERRGHTSAWDKPFATEYELGRACVEAVFVDDVDWQSYDAYTTDPLSEPSIHYTFEGKKYPVPERTEAMVTYPLRNGARVHVLNAKAVARPLGVPRPNSDSQTTEIINLLPQNYQDIVVVPSVPHIRAGLDIGIRLMKGLGNQLGDVAIASGSWMPHSNAMSALGEIPATHKADTRLRAVASGNDPDTPALLNL